MAINQHILLYDNLYDDSAINQHILLFDYVWQLWYVCFWVILTVALNVECGRRLKESICGATRSHAANSFLNAHCPLTAQNPPTCCNGQFWQEWSFTCLTGGNWAIIWKSGKWGKLKFCDFSFNMCQNLKFKKSYIVKSNSGLILSS